jgi:glycosyltransferase involved in cell wall biosynthesis
VTRRALYLQYTNPGGYPPLQHGSRILARDGWQVLFLGTDVAGVEALEFPAHPGIVVRCLSAGTAGWRRKLHYARFTAWAVAWALRWRPRLVYASDPLSCPVALLLGAVPGARVVYHEHDSPAEASRGGTEPSGPHRLVMAARRRLARRAVLSVLPNERRLARFQAAVGPNAPALCVWNCPARDEVRPARGAVRADGLWAVYHGSIVPSRLPPTVLEALALLPPSVRLRVIGYETAGHRGYVERLRETAEQLGIAARVEFHRAVPRGALLSWCERSDVGLALMPRLSDDVNEEAMAGASNKPFDYLACGAAVLVSDLPDWRAMYVEPGYGLACDPGEPRSVAAALRWLLERPAARRAMGERGRRRIALEWNYERQFRPVVDRIEGVSGPGWRGHGVASRDAHAR